MKVLINLNPVNMEVANNGFTVAAHNLAYHLLRQSDLQIRLATDKPLKIRMLKQLDTGALSRVYDPLFLYDKNTPSPNSRFERYRLSLPLTISPPDIYLDLGHGRPPLFSRSRMVFTILDLAFKIPEYSRYFSDALLSLLNENTDRIMKCAHSLVAISNFTKDEIIRCYGFDGKRIFVVPLGFDHGIFNESLKGSPAGVALLNKFNLERGRYFIHVGVFQPRKNLVSLVRAFVGTKHNGFKLVLAGGSGWKGDEVLDPIKKMQGNDVIILQQLSTEEIAMLLANAGCLVFPSLYEGFGLPLLEAMGTLTPILCSDIPPFKEICAEAAIYFNPLDIDDIGNKMREATVNHGFFDDKIEFIKKRRSLFSWESSGKRLNEALMNIGAISRD